MSNLTGNEPALPGNEPQPTGLEPGVPAEYAILDVVMTLSALDPAEREAAIELLVELGRDAVPALIRASLEPRRDSRLAAAHAMGIVADDDFLPELERLMCDPDEWVSTTAAKSYWALIGERGGRRAHIERLMMQHDPAPYAIRALALRLLTTNAEPDPQTWVVDPYAYSEGEFSPPRWLLTHPEVRLVPLQFWAGMLLHNDSRQANLQRSIAAHGAAAVEYVFTQLALWYTSLGLYSPNLDYVTSLLISLAASDEAALAPIADLFWHYLRHTERVSYQPALTCLRRIERPEPVITLLNRLYEVDDQRVMLIGELMMLLRWYPSEESRACLQRWARLEHEGLRATAQYVLDKM